MTPAEQVAAVEARARRVDTPCGAGTMAWRIWGNGDPLVVSHGAQGAWSHWIRNIDTLVAAGRQVIAVDLPGHGDSADPATPDHAGIVAALAAGLDHVLGPGGTADFAGFSFGGVMFAWAAAAHPQRFRRLVLIGTGGLDTPHGDIRLRAISGLRGEERHEALRDNLCGQTLHHRASADDLAVHLLVTNARKGSAVKPPQLVVPDRLVHILPRVNVPIDAIWGEHDRPHPDPARQAAVIRRTHPRAAMRVIPDCGHWAMYERSQAFNAALLETLATPPLR